jgi:predicted transcriptional regulator
MPTETVGEVMHKGVVTCSPATSLEEAVRIVSDSDVNALVVVGNAGEILGILSHMDILRHYGENLAERQVGEIMNPGVLSVQPDTPIQAAITVILNSRVHRLVVTTPGPNGNVPVGVISTTDIIRHLRGARWAWKWQ